MGGLATIDESTLPGPVREQLRRVSVAARAIECLTATLGVPGDAKDRAASAETVDLADFFVYLRERWSGEVAAKARRFDFAIGQGLPAALDVPRLALGRLIGNLVNNALNHGTGAIHLSVERSAKGGVIFRLANEGPPIDMAVVERVLHSDPRAFQANAAGHGLGLHIVRSLADEMRASVVVCNTADGVEFVVEFTRDRVVLAARPAAPDPAPAQPVSLAGVKLLLAEDNPTNQMVAVQMLGMLGADVTLAADGVEAVTAFESCRFDLVVVDIEMPRMSGLDVIRTIRARQDERARTPIVALTAYAMNEHRDRIAEAGANGLISKPIASIEALARALSPHVKREEPAPEPVAAAAAEPEVVDRVIYDALADAIGSEMMSELLEKVIADLSNSRFDLDAARLSLSRDPIRSASHILISVAGAIGATRLQHCARALNGRAHAPGEDGLAELVAQCIAEIDAAVAYAATQRACG